MRQLQAAGKGWDEILFVDFEDERLAEFQTEDFNSLLEAHLELYGKKPVVFLDEVQNIPYWDKFVRRLADGGVSSKEGRDKGATAQCTRLTSLCPSASDLRGSRAVFSQFGGLYK